MSALSRLQKLEEVAACDVPCAWHALADIMPRPVAVAPADIFAGTCRECGEDMDFNMADCMPRERELSAEFYPHGLGIETLTASRRSLAAMLWLSRRGKVITAAPGEVYKQALIDEHDRRMGDKWEAHWRTVPDEILEAAAELLEGDIPDAELEAIIWPEGAA